MYRQETYLPGTDAVWEKRYDRTITDRHCAELLAQLHVLKQSGEDITLHYTTEDNRITGYKVFRSLGDKRVHTVFTLLEADTNEQEDD